MIATTNDKEEEEAEAEARTRRGAMLTIKYIIV
jgi:hypothetical protein